jgi:serine phosphatase RsbU (regulator of sigma subunit)
MKIKQKLILSSTIVTIVVCVFVIVVGFFVSKNNLARDLNFSRNILNQLSGKYNDISKNFISDYTQEFLKIKTANLLYEITPFIVENKFQQKKITHDKRILDLLKQPLNINECQVGYFALTTGANKEIIGPSSVEQFSKNFYIHNFSKLNKLTEKALENGKSSGYYKFINETGNKIVNKYAVLFRVQNSNYILVGLLNTDNYNLAANHDLNKTVEKYYSTQEDDLILYYNKSLISKSIFFVICLLIIMIIYIFTLSFTMGIMTKPLRLLTEKLKKTDLDNLDYSIKTPKYSSLEVIELARSFTTQEKDLKSYMNNFKKEVETRHILEHELEVAKKIQNSVLPKISSEFIKPSFSIFAKLLSAKEVAGDFYDFFYLSENKIAFLIADVSGKGIPAALFMQRAKIILRASCATEKECPGKALANANHTLSKRNDACMFVTVFLIYYDIETGEISYANGGHHPTVKISGDKISDFGKLNDIALGTFETSKYKTGKTHIDVGETLILYTDGIIEAISPSYEEFGTSRLYKTIKASKDKSIEELGEIILKKVNKFEENGQFDDITILIFKRNIE